jgi:hypothetical protein
MSAGAALVYEKLPHGMHPLRKRFQPLDTGMGHYYWQAGLSRTTAIRLPLWMCRSHNNSSFNLSRICSYATHYASRRGKVSELSARVQLHVTNNMRATKAHTHDLCANSFR